MSKAPTRSAPPPPPPDHDEEEGGGASANERLLAAAKMDNETLLEDALDTLDNVNYTDGLGNTALHYAVQNASTSVLEHLLDHASCDVDPRNRLHGDTPLHIAVRQRWEDHDGLRLFLVEQLLEAGASTSIRNRHNERPVDLLPPPSAAADQESDDEKVRAAIRRAEAEAALGDRGDVVDGQSTAGQAQRSVVRHGDVTEAGIDDDDLVDPNDVASDSD